jgi:GNAT superfamily N-acetyltransferase
MSVRLMTEADIPAALNLLEQLGDKLTQLEVKRRLSLVMSSDDHRVWVFETNGRVAAMLHAFFRPALDEPPEVVVQALVVEESFRSNGIGEALMRAAEEWGRLHGSGSVSLYSHSRRKDAHRFYERLGYMKIATSDLMGTSLPQTIEAIVGGSTR